MVKVEKNARYFGPPQKGEKLWLKRQLPRSGHRKHIWKSSCEIRMDAEQRAAVQAHAEAHSESVNGFINRAISETMERDRAESGGGEE